MLCTNISFVAFAPTCTHTIIRCIASQRCASRTLFCPLVCLCVYLSHSVCSCRCVHARVYIAILRMRVYVCDMFCMACVCAIHVMYEAWCVLCTLCISILLCCVKVSACRLLIPLPFRSSYFDALSCVALAFATCLQVCDTKAFRGKQDARVVSNLSHCRVGLGRPHHRTRECVCSHPSSGKMIGHWSCCLA